MGVKKSETEEFLLDDLKDEKIKKAATTKAATTKTTATKTTATKAATTKAATTKAKPKKAFSIENANVHLQFAGKTYTCKDVSKIAKNVWVYDMGRKVSEIKSMEIYVKPEENMAYFVINNTETGKFLL